VSILTIYHGRISSETATFNEVEGVAFRKIDDNIYYVLECSIFEESALGLSIIYQGDQEEQPEITKYNKDIDGEEYYTGRVLVNHFGVYTCKNLMTGNEESIKFTEGMFACAL